MLLFGLSACNNSTRKANQQVEQTSSPIEKIKVGSIETIVDSLFICSLEKYNVFISKELKKRNLDKQLKVKLAKADSLIYDRTYTIKDFGHLINDSEFMSKAILYNAWFKGFSCDKKELIFSCSLTVPETDWTHLAIIVIDSVGKEQIHLEENNEVEP